MENGYRKTNNGQAFTFIQLDVGINQKILNNVIHEIEEYLTDEQNELFDDNLISIDNDGYGSIRIEWETDYNGDINPELAKMLEAFSEDGFWYTLPTVEEILFWVSEDGFWDGFLNGPETDDEKADYAKSHIETVFKYFPKSDPDYIIECFADWADFDASVIMAEYLLLNADKLAA